MKATERITNCIVGVTVFEYMVRCSPLPGWLRTATISMRLFHMPAQKREPTKEARQDASVNDSMARRQKKRKKRN